MKQAERNGLTKWNLNGDYESHKQRAKEQSSQEQKQLEKKRLDKTMWLENNREWKSEIRVKWESDHEFLIRPWEEVQVLILVQQGVIRRLRKWLSLCTLYFSIMLGTT